jgi:tetratricopeptide (TPR) repeat protein
MGGADAFPALVASCEEAFESGDTAKLRKALNLLQSSFPSEEELDLSQRAILAGLLIDAGAQLRISDVVDRGRRILEESSNALEPHGASQLHYNIGNAYQALYDIARSGPGWEFTPENVSLGLEAKSSYWRALAAVAPAGAIPEQLTNLGNALDSCGRVIDALYYYDTALKKFPTFGMALANRGHALLYLNRLSGSYSVKLLHEIYRSFHEASKSARTEPHARAGAAEQARRAAEILVQRGFDLNEDPESVKETESENDRHDSYWRWCLDHSFALCEHALYCRCSAARRDDLSILTPGAPLTGESVPAMELMLNRMKSEYCLARALLFQSAHLDAKLQWDVGPFEGTFTDLFDSEEIGLTPEFLRTSFRLCFGVLDRIARGVCTFLKLAQDDDKLYFDSFWRPARDGGARWQAINSRSSAGLVALYGLARDLNERGNGEWSRLKRYRNLLEHEFLLLSNTQRLTNESRWPLNRRIPSVPRDELQSDASDMLRFTRSAMFYFAFLVRMDSRSDGSKGNPVPIAFDKKPIGKA